MSDTPLLIPGALVVIPRDQLPAILAADTGDILGKLAARVRAHIPDVTTVKGRKEIASLAYEVSTSKTALTKVADGLTEGWRKQTAAVVAEKKDLEARMNTLRDEVRAPLDAFEAREAARVHAHEVALDAIVAGDFDRSTAAGIKARIEQIEAFPTRNWEEFEARFEHTRKLEIDALQRLFAATEAREAEAAELARLRKEDEERKALAAVLEQERREERLAFEAAEAARLLTEEKAEAERKEVERLAELERQQAAAAAAAAEIQAQAKIDEARQETERQRLAASQAAQEKAEAEARAKRAEEQAEADRQDATRRAEAAKATAEADAKRREAEAVVEERRRQKAAEAEVEAETARRSKDRVHRAAINSAALEALAKAGLSKEDAKKAVMAIALGKIPSVTINY